MSAAPALLFVAPILPAPTGNGLAMRAGVFLDALAHDHAVTLLLIPVAGGAVGTASPFVAARARRVVTVTLDRALDPFWTIISRIADPRARAERFAAYPRPAPCRYATEACRIEVAAALGTARFDAVHVMRSYMAPYAAPFLSPAGEPAAPRSSLDLDDDEAATHRRLAALAQRRGESGDARVLAAEALKYERHEATWLSRFTRIFTCTAAHAASIAAAHPEIEASVVANTVVLPPPPSRSTRASARNILFVGNLSYLPNVDGIAAFVRDVLPQLRSRLDGGVRLRIAGSAPVPEIRELAADPGVELVADPPDLAPHYAWADLAIVPLSAGGGTRIKLLEAFAHGVPVVATTIGAEGIDAQTRTHLLIADTPVAFVDACAELLSDSVQATRIAGAARRLVETRYGHADGVRAIRGALGG